MMIFAIIILLSSYNRPKFRHFY